jgi:hypothetical protein
MLENHPRTAWSQPARGFTKHVRIIPACGEVAESLRAGGFRLAFLAQPVAIVPSDHEISDYPDFRVIFSIALVAHGGTATRTLTDSTATFQF